MATLSPSKGDTQVLPHYYRPVMRQIGWLGQTGAVYEFDDAPYDGREPGGFSPLYIQVGTWEDLGDGHWGIKD